MNRITRYVVFDLIKSFAIALSAITALMVMVFLIQEGWREKLTGAAILKLIPFTLPTALSFAIPGTILFAVTVVYGRMGGANEIVAIKSLGIPPSRVIVPGLVLAVLLSLCTVFLNDLSVSWGRRGIYRVILQSSAQSIYSTLRSQGTFSKGKIYIDVDQVEGDVLINPFIVRTDDDTQDRLLIRALKARILVDPVEDQLVIQLLNGNIMYGESVKSWIDRKDFAIPLSDVTKKTGAADSPSNLALNEMANELTRQRVHVDVRQQALALKLVSQAIGGDMIGLTHPVWGAELYELQKQVYREHRLKTEPWRRWANGFSCLCFVLVGAPLAIQLRKFDFWTNFALCFIPILVIYYPLLMFGVGQAKSGSLPPFAVWFGNGVMLLIGIWLFRKVQNS
jgi:lipopolysaccharide export system permease protein